MNLECYNYANLIVKNEVYSYLGGIYFYFYLLFITNVFFKFLELKNKQIVLVYTKDITSVSNNDSSDDDESNDDVSEDDVSDDDVSEDDVSEDDVSEDDVSDDDESEDDVSEDDNVKYKSVKEDLTVVHNQQILKSKILKDIHNSKSPNLKKIVSNHNKKSEITEEYSFIPKIFKSQ